MLSFSGSIAIKIQNLWDSNWIFINYPEIYNLNIPKPLDMKIAVYFFILILPIFTMAQEPSPRTDKVLMITGAIKQGQVVAVNDQTITFVHQNESIQYKLKKNEISKIEFASGRIEIFNPIQPDFQGSNGTNLADHHNKVAILPFSYIRDGVQLKGDIMERKVQREFFSLLKGHVGVLKILDPQGVNAALIKHNINGDDIYQFTIPELANFLGVEYIVQGTLTINQSGTSSFGSTYGQAKSKSWNKVKWLHPKFYFHNSTVPYHCRYSFV